MEELISIVVPVYNVYQYLPRCLDGILAQTYPHWEAILVDDGSTDGICPGICDEYARKDPRFRVIHKTNGGVCSARNAGLQAAQGEYVVFCDQDDYFTPPLLELALRTQKEYPDGLVAWDVCEDAEGLETTFASEKPKVRVYSRFEMAQYYMTFAMAPIWNKLFRTKLLRQEPAMRFDENNRIGTEDMPFAFTYLKRYFASQPDGRIYLLPNCYHYYESGNGQSVSKASHHFATYCRNTLERDGPVCQDMENLFECPVDQLASVYRFYMHCLAYGIFLLGQAEHAERTRQQAELRADPEFRRMISWMRTNKIYSPYFLLFSLGWFSAIRRLYIWERKKSRWFGRADWLCYDLLGGSWQR